MRHGNAADSPAMESMCDTSPRPHILRRQPSHSILSSGQDAYYKDWAGRACQRSHYLGLTILFTPRYMRQVKPSESKTRISSSHFKLRIIALVDS